MRGKQDNSRTKYRNGEIITEKTEWINNMEKELQGLENGPKAKLHVDKLRTLEIPQAMEKYKP